MQIKLTSKSLSKKELRHILGVSRQTLDNYLNTLYYDELKEFGYNKHQKDMTPEQVKYLSEKLCFEIDFDKPSF